MANKRRISKRADGRYVATLTDNEGKRRYYYGKTHREVATKIEAAELERSAGRLVAVEWKTVGQYLDYWVQNVVKTAPNTKRMYLTRLGHVIPYIGHYELRSIAPRHIQMMYNDLVEVLSPRTVRLIHTTLSGAFKHGVHVDRVLPVNPTVGVKLPPLDDESGINPLNREQSQRLLETSRGDPYHALWVTLLGSGMRIGEALALHWSDIEWDAAKIHIQRGVQPSREEGGLHEGKLKTKRSHRHVPIGSIVLEALQEQRIRVKKMRLAAMEWERDDLVFPNTAGGHMRVWVAHTALQRAAKAAELPDITPHDLRHTYATALLHDLRIPVTMVSEWLGHADVTTTLRIYAHVLPEMSDEGGRKMDGWLRISA